jgi:predicted aldo/keto reductase-like oxidoreductase
VRDRSPVLSNTPAGVRVFQPYDGHNRSPCTDTKEKHVAFPNADETIRASMGRRSFLARAAAFGAGVAAGVAARADGAEVKLEHRNRLPGVVYRRLGRTNLAVSALGFGGVVLSPERMPAFEAAVKHGVNFIMAHGGACTEALGPWLRKPGNRDRIFLGLVGGARNIDSALQALGTDHVDLLMVPIHSVKPVPDEGLAKAFDTLKKAGKARFLCLVTHANVPAVWKKGLEVGWFDVILPTYNWPSRNDLKPLVAETRKKDVGLLAMKTLNGLPKGRDAVATWKTFLDDGIGAILKGMTDPKQVADYIRIATKGDKTAASHPIDCSGQCALCGRCEACPQGVAIQEILLTWQYYGQQLRWTDVARSRYSAIPAAAKATACQDCGRCELVCTQHLDVRGLLREAHDALA